MSKRIKITFESVNKGRYKIINPRDMSESNSRPKNVMKKVVREFNINSVLSQRSAGKLVINS